MKKNKGGIHKKVVLFIFLALGIILLSTKKMTVKTNKNCSGYDNFDGTYQYKGETSAKNTKDIKDNAGGF